MTPGVVVLGEVTDVLDVVLVGPVEVRGAGDVEGPSPATHVPLKAGRASVLLPPSGMVDRREERVELFNGGVIEPSAVSAFLYQLTGLHPIAVTLEPPPSRVGRATLTGKGA